MFRGEWSKFRVRVYLLLLMHYGRTKCMTEKSLLEVVKSNVTAMYHT